MSYRSSALYEQLIGRLVNWAKTQPDIRAAFIVGSRARVDHPADEWADLDIIVVTTDPQRYLSTSDWVEKIGNPLLSLLERTATGDEMERRVLFEGGLDVDFSIVSVERAKRLRGELPPQVVDVFRRGLRVLIDKEGIEPQLSVLRKAEASPHRPPTQTEFLQVVDDFLYHSLWTAKHLRRGELWWAKGGCDSHMKWNCLLPMMEWHTRTAKGWDYDTWQRGHFLEEWADPRIVQGLRDAFAHYDEEDVKRALFATMDLFRWIAVEVAKKLNYQYPTEADGYVTELVNECLLKS